MNTSSDGGQTFTSIVQIADTNAAFDYPIPSFDDRRAFIYVSTAVDLSNGPFQDRVYACWNDTDGPESGTPANNHSKITVTYSSNGGTTWTEVNPHPTADIPTVDRFNPWLDVDENGIVHVAFASTQNDVNRQNIDIYHSFSNDGGVTWSPPQRVTSVSSNYIPSGFQWGDYNGMAIVDGKVRPVWTDNRTAVRVYSADADFTNQGGDFELASNNSSQTICLDSDADPVSWMFWPSAVSVTRWPSASIPHCPWVSRALSSARPWFRRVR